MHVTGDYDSNGTDFSSSKWHHTTGFYIDKIQNDLTSENWTAIFQALRHLEEVNAQHVRVQTGALLTPKQREPLLPADPPTPPPLG